MLLILLRGTNARLGYHATLNFFALFEKASIVRPLEGIVQHTSSTTTEKGSNDPDPGLPNPGASLRVVERR